MLHNQPNPEGIDFYIQTLQNDLYLRLISLWPSNVVYESYGLCNRNMVDDQYRAEVYESGQYKDVLWDDRVDAISFFGKDTTLKNQTLRQIGVHLIFFCNPRKLKPDSTGRPDEEVRIDIMRILGKALFSFHFKTLETGIENVLREYKGSQAQVKSIDQGKVHAFRINFVLSYNPNLQSLKI